LPVVTITIAVATIVLSLAWAPRHSAKRHLAQCHSAQCHSAECCGTMARIVSI